ncbi:MAG: FGGY family carbohydrate kinase [Saprospiraceae bacterium]|nr:carbohydrate kinase [Lewinella sp.]
MKVTAIFDIGKTNKKFFLFDSNMQEIHKAYSRFDEIEDDDGFPADDLHAIQSWIREQFNGILQNEEFELRSLNFSTYGASFVHVDRYGQPVAPLYNYLKPYPDDILQSFYDKYGDPLTIAGETASPALGMLNSGLQLYWLKYAKPEVFAKIRWSLHLPQYISYMFTGIPVSDYTSIGCHTGLWNYEKDDYHDWVYAEEIDRILPPIVPTSTSICMDYEGQQIKIGTGIHDSSSALLPYIMADSKPFLLLSTGTWSIALNPYSEEVLTESDLSNDCLNYMRIDGKPVKAARLFLGNEYKLQAEQLCEHFQKEYGAHKQVRFDPVIYGKWKAASGRYFRLESIPVTEEQPEQTQYEAFQTFEEAFHRLMIELVDLQVEAAKRAIGNTAVKKLYVDGGFADNEIFVHLLSIHFPDYKLRTTQSPLGSALGASMVISEKKIGRKFLKKHYAMRKHRPVLYPG